MKRVNDTTIINPTYATRNEMLAARRERQIARQPDYIRQINRNHKNLPRPTIIKNPKVAAQINAMHQKWLEANPSKAA